jgi:transposase
MGLIAVKETAELFRRKNISMTERDTEFVVQFAFRTDDRELTEKLIDELVADGADRDAICRKYQTLVGFVPDWIQRIENLLISLEMYRVQEEQAIKTLSELLSACGISMSEEEIRQTDTARVQERIKKEASL